MATNPRAIDALQLRNNTFVALILDGQRVGRVQQFSQSRNNNVQVVAELGRDVMVEMLKGIEQYTFTIASFYCRVDVMDNLKGGDPFSLAIRDEGAGTTEVVESFASCMITSLTRDYTTGQAAIGQNAQVVTIGRGIGVPTSA